MAHFHSGPDLAKDNNTDCYASATVLLCVRIEKHIKDIQILDTILPIVQVVYSIVHFLKY